MTFERPTRQRRAREELSGAPGPGGAYDGAWTADDIHRPLYGATFGQAVKRFFRNYRRFSGRASRSEFWWVQLFLVLGTAATFIPTLIGANILAPSANAGDAPTAAGSGALSFAGSALLTLFWAACALPSLAINWRRLHDVNLTGALYLITLIPYAGIGVVILTFQAPKAAGRRYDRDALPPARTPDAHRYGTPVAGSDSDRKAR